MLLLLPMMYRPRTLQDDVLTTVVAHDLLIATCSRWWTVKLMGLAGIWSEFSRLEKSYLTIFKCFVHWLTAFPQGLYLVCSGKFFLAKLPYVLLCLASNQITRIKLPKSFTLSCPLADNKKFKPHKILLENKCMEYWSG